MKDQDLNAQLDNPKRFMMSLSLTKRERVMLLEAARSFRDCDSDTLRINVKSQGQQVRTPYGEVTDDLMFSWGRIIHQLEGKALLNSEFDNRKQPNKCPKCGEMKVLIGNHIRHCGKPKKIKMKRIKLPKPDRETLERLRLL